MESTHSDTRALGQVELGVMEESMHGKSGFNGPTKKNFLSDLVLNEEMKWAKFKENAVPSAKFMN